jgi:hypothetical protein
MKALSKTTVSFFSLRPSLTKPSPLEYNIHTWPVPVTNEIYLDEIKSTHDVRQIPAYNDKNKSIHPSEYEEHLAGSISRVSFSVVHYLIRQRHVFNATVRDITVLRPPSTIAPTSLKNILHPSPAKKRRLV